MPGPVQDQQAYIPNKRAMLRIKKAHKPVHCYPAFKFILPSG